jgi:deoxyribonuclease-1-like protein
MFAIRRRWPVLTAAGAALLYVVNNYQITGLEHLHVQRLEHPRDVEKALAAHPISGVANSLGIDLTQFGIQTSPSLHTDFSNQFPAHHFAIDPYAATSAPQTPAWNQQLSLGEKVALWEDQLTKQAASLTTGPLAQPIFPSSSPIPPPLGLSLPTTGQTAQVESVQRSTPVSPLPQALPQAPLSHTVPRLDQTPIPSGMMTALSPTSPATTFGHAPQNLAHTIRVAAFNVPALGTAMLNKPQVVQLIVSILRQYEVVALQGIETNRDDVLPLIVDKLNQSGRSYDYLIGPRVGRSAPHRQFAYVFDTSRIETDRYQLYSIDDPEDLISYEPLVAWFRCKGVPTAEAFTFSLVNVAIHPSFAEAERSILPALIEAVQKDGRQEDDWILLGDFAGGNAQLSMLDPANVRFAISDIPTDVAGTQMLNTIIFSPRATTEFSGRAGAFDFLRKYNLSMEQAVEISPHMPVWAEFSALEGAQPGRVAPIAGSIQ